MVTSKMPEFKAFPPRALPVRPTSNLPVLFELLRGDELLGRAIREDDINLNVARAQPRALAGLPQLREQNT
jgi:hypothetical protein